MESVTLRYWYDFAKDGEKEVFGTFAECPRCRTRVFVEGASIEGRAECARLMAGRCPRQEGNAYSTEFLPRLIRP